MEKVHFNFEDLKVYQKALDFTDHAYSLTAKFPQSELYGLTSQFNRAAVSIALNTSEGSGNTDANNSINTFRLPMIRYGNVSLVPLLPSAEITLLLKKIKKQGFYFWKCLK